MEKNRRNYCADPFNMHKAKRLKSVRLASAALISVVNDERIGKETYLCITCRKKLAKDPQSLPLMPTKDDTVSEESDVLSRVSSTSSQAQGRDETRQELDKEDTEQVLHVLDQTPMRTGKFYVM